MCMTTIKIFLASSCELAYERMIIGDKIRQADDKWRAKGVRLQLMVWEDYRPEFLGVRTQTEYDEYLVNDSQIVIGLFKNRCGKYTQEEIVLAKRNNSENLHVFTLPADDGVNLVSDFLTKESIVGIKCSDIDHVCSEVRNVIEDYIAKKECDNVMSANSSLSTDQIYATIGADIPKRSVELGNMVRSVNDALEGDNISRCILMEKHQKEMIPQSDYYVALPHEHCNLDEEEEIVTAIKASAGDRGKLPVAIYLEKGSLLLNNSQKISNALTNFGVFTIEFGTMNDVKTNLFLYLYRKRKGNMIVFDDFSGFAYSEGCVTFAGYMIAAVKSLFQDYEVLKQCQRLDCVRKQLESLIHKKDAKSRNEKVVLNNEMDNLVRYVNEILTLKFASLQTRNIETDMDESQPLNLESINNSIDIQEKSLSILHKKKELIFDTWLSTIRALVARLNYLVSVGNIHVDEIKSVAKSIYGLLQRIIANGVTIPDERMQDIMQLLQATYDQYGGDYDEDEFFHIAFNWADKRNISSEFIETCRFNFANALMRNEDPTALQLYKTVLANLKQIDDHSISSHRFVIKVYTSIAHGFIELERNEDAWGVIQQMGHDINEWNDPINVRLLQSSDFYAAQLRAIPERWDDGMQDVISHAVLIFNQCREHLTITPKDYHYVYCFCYLPNVISAFIIDRMDYMNESKKGTLLPLAFEMLESLLRYSEIIEGYDPIEGMTSASQGYHNRGFLYYKLRRWNEAILDYQKALDSRRFIYEYMPHKENKRVIGETLVNIGAAQLEWCKESHTIEGHNPIDTAKEALSIYENLYNKDYPLSEVDINKAKQLIATSYYYIGSLAEKQLGLEMMKEIYAWLTEHRENSYIASFLDNTVSILKMENLI